MSQLRAIALISILFGVCQATPCRDGEIQSGGACQPNDVGALDKGVRLVLQGKFTSDRVDGINQYVVHYDVNTTTNTIVALIKTSGRSSFDLMMTGDGSFSDVWRFQLDEHVIDAFQG